MGVSPLKITFDDTKRLIVLEKHGIDLRDAKYVFDGEHIELEDNRKDYGELRYRVWGFLRGRRVSLVWTPRGEARRIITMRYAHEQEHEAIFRTLD